MSRTQRKRHELLTDVERRWYDRFAADILGGDYVRDRVRAALQLILHGALGVCGILWWRWSAEEELAFLVLGLWVGLGRNVIKIAWMYQGMQNLVRTFEETGGRSNIWYIVARLRTPGTRNTRDARQNQLGIQQAQGKLKEIVRHGTAADLALGGLSTGVLFFAAMKGEFHFRFSELAGSSFALAAAAYLAYEGWLTVHEVVDFRRDPNNTLVMLYPGYTGAALLLLVVAAVLANAYAPQAATTWMMLSIFGIVATAGVLWIVFAVITWRKTLWLARQLADHPGSSR